MSSVHHYCRRRYCLLVLHSHRRFQLISKQHTIRSRVRGCSRFRAQFYRYVAQ